MADVSLVMTVEVEWLSPVLEPKYGSNRDPWNFTGNSDRDCCNLKRNFEKAVLL